MHAYIYIHTHTHIIACAYAYIYIYVSTERQREREVTRPVPRAGSPSVSLDPGFELFVSKCGRLADARRESI